MGQVNISFRGSTQSSDVFIMNEVYAFQTGLCVKILIVFLGLVAFIQTIAICVK